MLRKFKIPIIVVVTVLLNQAAGYAVHAGMPEAFLPSGTTRYAVTSATNWVVTNSSAYVDVPGLSSSVTIPTGKHGDFIILFCGATTTASGQLDEPVRALVGGVAAPPSEAIMNVNNVFRQARCANFYKLNVTAGTRTIKMQWHSLAAIDIHLADRSMIVIVNVH